MKSSHENNVVALTGIQTRVSNNKGESCGRGRFPEPRSGLAQFDVSEFPSKSPFGHPPLVPGQLVLVLRRCDPMASPPGRIPLSNSEAHHHDVVRSPQLDRWRRNGTRAVGPRPCCWRSCGSNRRKPRQKAAVERHGSCHVEYDAQNQHKQGVLARALADPRRGRCEPSVSRHGWRANLGGKRRSCDDRGSDFAQHRDSIGVPSRRASSSRGLSRRGSPIRPWTRGAPSHYWNRHQRES